MYEQFIRERIKQLRIKKVECGMMQYALRLHFIIHTLFVALFIKLRYS